MGKSVVAGGAIEKVLKDGAVITLVSDDIKALLEARHYRFNYYDELEYSDNRKDWRIADISVSDLKGEYLIVGENEENEKVAHTLSHLSF